MVLTILPLLYRRWASLRLDHLQEWICTWRMPEMHAGVSSAGADDECTRSSGIPGDVVSAVQRLHWYSFVSCGFSKSCILLRDMPY